MLLVFDGRHCDEERLMNNKIYSYITCGGTLHVVTRTSAPGQMRPSFTSLLPFSS